MVIPPNLWVYPLYLIDKITSLSNFKDYRFIVWSKIRTQILKVPVGNGLNMVDTREIKIVPEKQSFHDKFIKDLADNTPHEGQFGEDI